MDKLHEIEELTTKNIIFQKRTKDIGILPKDRAIELGVTGPVLRASGVAEDIRRSDPFLLYKGMDFPVITREEGDCFARTEVRIEEMRASAALVKKFAVSIPEGPLMAGPFVETTPEKWPDSMSMANMLKVFSINIPAGEWFLRHESPRGEIAMHLISTGGLKPYRLRLKSPSFCNLYALSSLVPGTKIADMISILGSLDIVFGEVDR